MSDEDRLARKQARKQADRDSAASAVERVAELIGLSPRWAALRQDLAARFPTVGAGEHLAAFARTFCRYTQLGEVMEGGPRLGDPYELEAFEREVLDEALTCDEQGRRVYDTAGLVIPRKNRKTTTAAVLSLYFGSPADGEHRPLVVQAAGVRDQAGKLYETTRAFIDDPAYGSALLDDMMLVSTTEIRCPAIGGTIKRVAGDGDNNHSLDPHVVIADELHAWKTPKQRENWRALTTAQGGRLDPFVLFISTEGEGDDNELAALLERVESSPTTEMERRRPGLTIFRDRENGLLVFKYAIPSSATVADLDAFKLANPAPWRTRERLAKDLATPKVDEPTKLRLYGNRRGSPADRWISEERWVECHLPGSSADDEGFIPGGATVAVGVDAARKRDTTAVGWAWIDEKGCCRVRCRVWSTRQETAHHVYVPGGRLDNDLARDFIRHGLGEDLGLDVRLLFYDERYFDTQANDLADEDGITVVEMHQGKPEMQAAWDGFYQAIHEGGSPSVLHDGCPVLRAHVARALGVRTERGWKVSKKKTGGSASSLHEDLPIDGLAAVVMARHAAVHLASFAKRRPVVFSW